MFRHKSFQISIHSQKVSFLEMFLRKQNKKVWLSASCSLQCSCYVIVTVEIFLRWKLRTWIILEEKNQAQSFYKVYVAVCLFLINKHINQLHNDDSYCTKLLISVRPRISLGDTLEFLINVMVLLHIPYACYLNPTLE